MLRKSTVAMTLYKEQYKDMNMHGNHANHRMLLTLSGLLNTHSIFVQLFAVTGENCSNFSGGEFIRGCKKEN